MLQSPQVGEMLGLRLHVSKQMRSTELWSSHAWYWLRHLQPLSTEPRALVFGMQNGESGVHAALLSC